jgi:hypothetical protein
LSREEKLGERMDNPDSITAHEARKLRRWFWTYQVGVVALFPILLLQIILFGEDYTLIHFLFTMIPLGIILELIRNRVVHCIRCRENIYGPRNVDYDTSWPGELPLGTKLPEQCHYCGVNLRP